MADQPISASARPQQALADPGVFYAGVRKVTGPLSDAQVQTITALLDWAARWCIGWLAYGLATAWHESRLVPQKEWGSAAYLARYDTGALAKALGNTPEADGDGQLYAGRGLVQLTGRRNYQWASAVTGIDLIANPDRAIETNIAAQIMVVGMQEGAFTGKRLADYIADRGTVDAFVQARRIINSLDRAEMIAGYAEQFQDALGAGGWK